MRLRSALLAATVLAAPAAALAQPIDGLYVGAGAGFNYLEDQTVKGLTGVNPATGAPVVAFPTNANLRSQAGWVALGSIGCTPETEA